MRRDIFTLQLDLGSELIIDNFAGGGGTSTGLEAAFGRPVDIAINHDPEALAMHALNHPYTRHLCESVWDVDPVEVTNNEPIGLVWLSPDCKHFSKAKGGKPVEKKIRGLAWVAMRWALQKPRVLMLENVEEFQTWGPLIAGEDGGMYPDPARRGQTFEAFKAALTTGIPADHPDLPEIAATLGEEFPISMLIAGLGYQVEFRELRASDHNTPTIRKRLFMVARRDGLPIVWPEQTHAAPDHPLVKAGKLQPYRTAAECIDWSLPCPSIFDRKRPLAPATLRRIAKGIMRYVVENPKPFIVGQGGPIYAGKPVPVTQPLGTLTTENHRAVVMPTLVQTGYGEREGQAPRALDIKKPLGTVVSGQKHALVSAFLNEHANASNQRVMPADEPLRTICAQVKGGHFSMVSAALVGVGGRAGDSRPRGLDEPTATTTSKYDVALATAVLVDTAHADVSPTGVKRWGEGVKDIELPLGTISTNGNSALATAFLEKSYGGHESPGWPLDKPVSTVTTQDHHRLITAHVTKFRTGSTGSDMAEPMPTITAGPKENPAGAPHALGVVSSHLVKLRGTSTAAAMDEPMHTISAQGQHHAEVRAFLMKYYSTDQDPQLQEPLHTITTKDRFGLVTIHGQDYQIVDIGLRMLAPHELYRAQGFPQTYVIDEIPDPELLFVNGQQVDGDPRDLPRIPLPKSSQVRMCGNSVCPTVAEALIRANFAHERELQKEAA